MKSYPLFNKFIHHQSIIFTIRYLVKFSGFEFNSEAIVHIVHHVIKKFILIKLEYYLTAVLFLIPGFNIRASLTNNSGIE